MIPNRMRNIHALITETVVQIAVKAARVKVEAMAMANAENNQRAQNVGPN